MLAIEVIATRRANCCYKYRYQLVLFRPAHSTNADFLGSYFSKTPHKIRIIVKNYVDNGVQLSCWWNRMRVTLTPNRREHFSSHVNDDRMATPWFVWWVHLNRIGLSRQSLCFSFSFSSLDSNSQTAAQTNTSSAGKYSPVDGPLRWSGLSKWYLVKQPSVCKILLFPSVSRVFIFREWVHPIRIFTGMCHSLLRLDQHVFRRWFRGEKNSCLSSTAFI